jgi:hypothetical protein
MLIEAAEKRFVVEAIAVGHLLEFHNDDGRAFIALETRRVASRSASDPSTRPRGARIATAWPRAQSHPVCAVRSSTMRSWFSVDKSPYEGRSSFLEICLADSSPWDLIHRLLPAFVGMRRADVQSRLW